MPDDTQTAEVTTPDSPIVQPVEIQPEDAPVIEDAPVAQQRANVATTCTIQGGGVMSDSYLSIH